MLDIKNQLIDPQDLMCKIKKEVSLIDRKSLVTGMALTPNALGGHIKTIESSLSKIQTRLQPKHALSLRFKHKFFIFRFKITERILLKFYNLFTREQKETTYQLSLVCQTLLQSCIALQAQIETLKTEELP